MDKIYNLSRIYFMYLCMYVCFFNLLHVLQSYGQHDWVKYYSCLSRSQHLMGVRLMILWSINVIQGSCFNVTKQPELTEQITDQLHWYRILSKHASSILFPDSNWKKHSTQIFFSEKYETMYTNTHIFVHVFVFIYKNKYIVII